jgi:transcription antitermination factor NusG
MKIRVPRMNVRREIQLPMLPSFVFVRSCHLPDVIELASTRANFSVFRYLDQIPIISDSALAQLRLSEREAIPRDALPSFGKGAKVRVTNGAFQGLKAKVERCRDGIAVVIFTDWHRPVKISTSILREDDANVVADASVAKAA